MYVGVYLKYPDTLVGFSWKLAFHENWIFEKYSNKKFCGIRLVGAEMFHADRQTDKHKDANIRFSQ